MNAGDSPVAMSDLSKIFNLNCSEKSKESTTFNLISPLLRTNRLNASSALKFLKTFGYIEAAIYFSANSTSSRNIISIVVNGKSQVE